MGGNFIGPESKGIPKGFLYIFENMCAPTHIFQIFFVLVKYQKENSLFSEY